MTDEKKSPAPAATGRGAYAGDSETNISLPGHWRKPCPILPRGGWDKAALHVSLDRKLRQLGGARLRHGGWWALSCGCGLPIILRAADCTIYEFRTLPEDAGGQPLHPGDCVLIRELAPHIDDLREFVR